MKKEKIHISAPITGRDINERKLYFSIAAEQLRKLGYTAVNPLAAATSLTLTHEEYMRADIALLLRCDGYIQARRDRLSRLRTRRTGGRRLRHPPRGRYNAAGRGQAAQKRATEKKNNE